MNHLQLPINRPLAPVHSHSQDGAANSGSSRGGVKDEAIRVQIAAFAFRADPEYGTRLAAAANADLAKVQAVAAGLTE